MAVSSRGAVKHKFILVRADLRLLNISATQAWHGYFAGHSLFPHLDHVIDRVAGADLSTAAHVPSILRQFFTIRQISEQPRVSVTRAESSLSLTCWQAPSPYENQL